MRGTSTPIRCDRAVEELLAAGCETIVYQCFSNPVYSDFEEYAYALPVVHQACEWRARVICADQLGNQPALREAYVQIIRDQVTGLPRQSRVLLILSRHGHPFKKETLNMCEGGNTTAAGGRGAPGDGGMGRAVGVGLERR
jgi:protoheme ferro-lyase